MANSYNDDIRPGLRSPNYEFINKNVLIQDYIRANNKTSPYIRKLLIVQHVLLKMLAYLDLCQSSRKHVA